MQEEVSEASEIVRKAVGRRPDFPSGKDYVGQVRGHINIRVRCPTGCAWGQFPDEEPAGMTPCYSCNSTGYVYEPLIGEAWV